MTARVSKLFYVHDGDAGALGAVLEETRRIVNIPIEGSGVLAVDGAGKGTVGRTVALRVDVVAAQAAPPDLRALVSGQTPCLVAQSGSELAILVNRAALSRTTASVTDLRGKIRYGLARIGWAIE